MTSEVVTIETSQPASRAARLMADRHVGCLVVTTSETTRAVGIITERDLVWKIVADNVDPSKVFVGDVMTAPLITIASNQTVEDAAKVMTQYGVRRLPVIDNNALIGIITTTDLARMCANKIEAQALLPILNAVSRAGKVESGPYG